MIWLADTSENGWGAVDEFKGNDFADDEEDSQKMAKSDRSAGEKRRWMAAQKGPDQKCVRQITPAWPQSYPQPLPLLQAALLSPTHLTIQPIFNHRDLVGPLVHALIVVKWVISGLPAPRDEDCILLISMYSMLMVGVLIQGEKVIMP